MESGEGGVGRVLEAEQTVAAEAVERRVAGRVLGVEQTVAAKALESAVSTLGSGSKHWGVDVHSACGY